MATFLFDDIIFGPVQSRRLGRSLGINLLPTTVKYCNFNCIYCECGWNTPFSDKPHLPTKEQISDMLETRLIESVEQNKPIDAITFAGNGEPTLHPDFSEIIDQTIKIRNKFYPKAQIAVLSNAALLNKATVVEALKKVDRPILKLDSAVENTFRLINQPKSHLSVSKITEYLTGFNGEFVLQTLFVKGIYKGQTVDNTTKKEVADWIDIVKQLRPREVMIYTIARDTPIDSLEKVPEERLNEIALLVQDLGIDTQISA